MTRNEMTSPRAVEHGIVVDASPDDVYAKLADVEYWPQLFPPSVYVRRLEHDGSEERIQIWATANGEPKTWTSRRILDPVRLSIEFRQERSAPPVAEMSGTWLVEPEPDGTTRLRLLHEYRAVDDDPAGLQWIDDAVDRNSTSELASLKAALERATAAPELTRTFYDEVIVNGDVEDVYDFLNQADRWHERLPHVAEVACTESTPGVQVLRMTTVTKDGSSHVTESVRVCFPYQLIVYKQTTLPALMSLHTGQWTLQKNRDDTVTVRSWHTVTIAEERIADVLGQDAGVDEAGEFLRHALGANSRATLGHAKEYAEARR